MIDDYYVVLGISRDAGLMQIRRAFRRLSMRFHPDVTGEEGVEQFERIRAAYQTLGHPVRKADYDRDLSLADQARAASGWIEPLTEQPIDLMADFETMRPGASEILRHLLENFGGHAPKSQPMKALNIEIMLTPEQAQRGGHMPMMVPVARVCGVCGGVGRTGFFICEACEGHGIDWVKVRVNVAIPRNVHDGSTVETPLHHLGIRNMWLRTTIRIQNA